MREYKITNVQRRDEWSSQYGPMVTFALALEGEQGWIKMNQKVTTPEPHEGQVITGEITNETTKNGESFRKFKKINPQYAGQPSQPQQQSQASPQLDYIVQMLEELTGRREAADLVPPIHQPDDPFEGMKL